MIDLPLMTQGLLKVLTDAGLGSRRKMAEAIKAGRVVVNGAPVSDFRYPVNLPADRVSLDGQPLKIKARQTLYLMLHKPAGVLSTARDERGRPTVLDILPERYRHYRLYPVGRLDLESTGLLLLTNDGDLTFRLTHPRFEHEKEYLLKIEGQLTTEEMRKLEQGIHLEDGVTSPARVRTVSAKPFNYSITLHEGRKRQIHRMLASLGHRVLALKRIRVGTLTMGSLCEGAVRELTAQEISSVLAEPSEKELKSKRRA